LSNSPASPGSGGGGGSAVFDVTHMGEAGGGYVQIVASGMVTINGLITARGTNNATSGSRGGGGSGGGIYIQAESLTGNGTIRADGGNGGNLNNGGGGGGGRIACLVRKAPFYTGGRVAFSATAAGGTGSSNGAPGTIYYNFKPRGTMFSAW
jgi:hypothetical protein